MLGSSSNFYPREILQISTSLSTSLPGLKVDDLFCWNFFGREITSSLNACTGRKYFAQS